MPSRSERDVVLDQVLQNEENLGVALKIISVYDELCGRVIVAFLEALVAHMAGKLSDRWTVLVRKDLDKFTEKWTEFLTLTYRDHPSQFYILLAGDGIRYPKAIYFGVSSSASAEINGPVKKIIDREYVTGSVGGCFWHKYLDKRYSFWGNEEVTLELFRKTDLVYYFADHIVRLSRAVEIALTSIQATSGTLAGPIHATE